jgi:hypothetical protein
VLFSPFIEPTFISYISKTAMCPKFYPQKINK